MGAIRDVPVDVLIIQSRRRGCRQGAPEHILHRVGKLEFRLLPRDRNVNRAIRQVRAESVSRLFDSPFPLHELKLAPSRGGNLECVVPVPTAPLGKDKSEIGGTEGAVVVERPFAATGRFRNDVPFLEFNPLDQLSDFIPFLPFAVKPVAHEQRFTEFRAVGVPNRNPPLEETRFVLSPFPLLAAAIPSPVSPVGAG